MRDISSDLLNAQNYGQYILVGTSRHYTRIPYVQLVFHSESGSGAEDYSNRFMGIEHHVEHLGNDYATIQLNNYDHKVKDVVGWWIEPVYGDCFFNTSKAIIGHEGHAMPRLWVKYQTDVSYPGKKMVVLELEDKKLAEKPCITDDLNPLAPYHYAELTGFTPFWMITHLLNHAGFGMQVLEQDDGFINSFIPQKFRINEDLDDDYESFKDVIERLLAFTKCYLRKIVDTGGGPAEYKVIFPQESDPINETYYSYQQPQFSEFAYREKVVIPNYILTYCNYTYIEGEDGNWDNLIIGEAQDQDSIDRYGEVMMPVWRKEAINQDEANFLASAYLDRYKIASKGGRVIVPLDMRVELFDKVQVYDTR
jgi:hypothetical protein